jgi:hypothetical protein
MRCSIAVTEAPSADCRKTAKRASASLMTGSLCQNPPAGGDQPAKRNPLKTDDPPTTV